MNRRTRTPASTAVASSLPASTAVASFLPAAATVASFLPAAATVASFLPAAATEARCRRARPPAVLLSLAVCVLLAGATELVAQGPAMEGDHLYRVITVRAAPGHVTELTDLYRESFRVVEEAGDERPVWMRHSQGDHWDLMLLYPMGSFEAYHAVARSAAWADGSEGGRLRDRIRAATAEREVLLARGPDVSVLRKRADGAGLFHVEMFVGLPGKRAELVEQRRMENRYYLEQDRDPNLIFVREGGARWDAFTLGFHPDLAAFAEAGGTTYTEQDAAARAAGFESVDAIGPYLRSLIAYHRDTLAVPVE